MIPYDCLILVFQYCGDKQFILFSSTCKELWNRINLKFIWIYTEMNVNPLQHDFIPINSFNTKIVGVYDSYLRANNYFNHTYDHKNIERPNNIIRIISNDDINLDSDSYEYNIYSLQYTLEFK